MTCRAVERAALGDRDQTADLGAGYLDFQRPRGLPVGERGPHDRLAQRRAISRDEYNGLQHDARNVERRLADRSRNGLNRREYAEIQGRIARLEQRISHEVNDGRRYGYNNYNGYNNSGWVDRDRDGRNDRYEDDQGYRHD